jgi:hypothetical protein
MSQFLPLTSLIEWERNKDLRGISQKGEEMLEKNLELGQHSTLLVKQNADGTYTALGGNNRLRKMRTMQYTEADCKVYVPHFEEGKGWYPEIDQRVYRNAQGEVPKYYQTEEELDLVMAFSHNTNPAFWNENEVINMMGNYPVLDWKMFTAEFEEKISLSDLENRFTPQDFTEKNQEIDIEKLAKDLNMTCPRCGFEFKGNEGLDNIATTDLHNE